MNNNWSKSVIGVTFCVVFLFFLMIRSSLADDNFCWKNSYGRGVGTVPTDCGPGNEYSNGICYPQCRPGYEGIGPVCWQRACPPGFTKAPGFCNANQASYGRGAGYVIWDEGKCNSRNSQGCEKNGLLWYPKCRQGYKGNGPVCWVDCASAGMKGVAPSCIIDSYGRGVGNLNYKCNTDKQYDAGLCYTGCAAKHSGVGPVCWGECPASLPVNCGAGCAVSSDACAQVITDQVVSVVEMVSNIVLTVATAGSGTAVKTAAKAAATTATNAAKNIAKGTTKAAIKESLKKAAQKAGKEISESALEGWAQEMAKGAAGQEIDLESLTALDPTGVSSVVLAYKQDVCTVDSQPDSVSITPQVWSIGVDSTGEAWVLGRDGVPGGYPPFRFDSVSSTWEKMPGGLIQIAIGPDGPWGVNNNKDIFRWVNGAWEYFPPFKANGIAVGPTGELWAVSTLSTPGGFTPFRWNAGSNAWDQMPGGVTQLAVGPDGPWAVNDQKDIFRWVNNNWQHVPGKSYGVGISPLGEVWVVGTNAVPSGGYSPYRYNNSLGIWERMLGGITKIAVGPTGPWAINDSGTIFRWQNNNWQQVPNLTGVGGVTP